MPGICWGSGVWSLEYLKGKLRFGVKTNLSLTMGVQSLGTGVNHLRHKYPQLVKNNLFICTGHRVRNKGEYDTIWEYRTLFTI